MSKENKEDLLKVAAFKLDQGDGIFAYLIYRPIVYVLMKGIYSRRGGSPNRITAFAIFLYVFAGLILIIEGLRSPLSPHLISWMENYLSPLIEIFGRKLIGSLTVGRGFFLLFYNLALLLDCLDGAVARYYGVTSSKGRLLDSFGDSFGHIFVLMGLSLLFFQYAVLIAMFFLAYYALSITHLSYKFEQLKEGKATLGEVRPLFKIGRFKILLGTLDYFVMSVNLIIIVSVVIPRYLEVILYLLDIFWLGCLVGYVLVVASGYKVVV